MEKIKSGSKFINSLLMLSNKQIINYKKLVMELPRGEAIKRNFGEDCFSLLSKANLLDFRDCCWGNFNEEIFYAIIGSGQKYGFLIKSKENNNAKFLGVGSKEMYNVRLSLMQEEFNEGKKSQKNIIERVGKGFHNGIKINGLSIPQG